MQFIQAAKKFIRDEEGVTAIEYGLIAALISIVIIIAAGTAGDALEVIFDRISAALTGASTRT